MDVTSITGNSYDLGDSGPKHDGVDGRYGSKTAAAVRKFKSDENLGYTQYGDVGPGTMHRLDGLFSRGTAPPTPEPRPTAAPTFRIVGSVKATATPDETPDFPSTMFFGFTDGHFQIDAMVTGTASNSADFDDWEIGIVQQVAGPMLRYCFAPTFHQPNPALSEVFVEDADYSFLMTDRLTPIWMRPTSFRDLRGQPPGTLSLVPAIPIHSHDTPGYHLQLTSLSATRPSDPKSQNKSISRSTHFGLFQTFIIARRKSTNQPVPLHIVEWVMFSEVDWSTAGVGIPFAGKVSASRFAIMTNRPASPSDLLAPLGAPAVGGVRKRHGTFQPRCPTF